MKKEFKEVLTKVAVGVLVFSIVSGIIRVLWKVTSKKAAIDAYDDVENEGQWDDPDLEAEFSEV